MSLQKLLSIPHIQSTIFQYLYAFDIGCDDLWKALDYDTEDSAFKFCKAVSANIYIERDVMLNQLRREILNIKKQLHQTESLYNKMNENWSSYQSRFSDKMNENWSSSQSRFSDIIEQFKLYHDHLDLMFIEEVIERMISGVEEFYLHFNREYNNSYESFYEF